jgi:flagellar protein FlaJ
MIEDLKKNIESEIKIFDEMNEYYLKSDSVGKDESKMLIQAAESLRKSMKIVNNSIPQLLNEIQIIKRIGVKSVQNEVKFERIVYEKDKSSIEVVLSNKDKNKFLSELSISEDSLKKLKKRKGIEVEKDQEFKKARGFLKYSNKWFLDSSKKIIAKGNMQGLALEIKKANIDILFETYVSMILFTTCLSVIFSVVGGIFVGIVYGILQGILFVLVVPVIVFFSLYIYPSLERKSISNKIDQELPFAVIHMSAISGSGIEPSEIFKIIGLSREYPNLRKEIRKVINQINLYGYDLITALNNASKNSPSEKLAELFSGLSSTISSGGELKDFFEKRAEGLLVGYRLEREKFTKVAETLMDIYITVVIMAPMMLVLVFVILSVTGLGLAFSEQQLGIIISAVIALINLVFLGVLQIKQPTY